MLRMPADFEHEWMVSCWRFLQKQTGVAGTIFSKPASRAQHGHLPVQEYNQSTNHLLLQEENQIASSANLVYCAADGVCVRAGGATSCIGRGSHPDRATPPAGQGPLAQGQASQEEDEERWSSLACE